MLDDLPYIFRNIYGVNWKSIDAAKKVFSELHTLGVSHNLRIDYPTYQNTIIHHTTFLNCIFEVHRRVRDVIFGEKYWQNKMGDLGISEECLRKKWDRDKLMMYVKYNTPEDIMKNLRQNYNNLQVHPVVDDNILIDRNGNIIPERNDDQEHLRKKNYINGVDRTAWVYSSQPLRNRERQRLNVTGGFSHNHEEVPTKIAEFEDLEHMENVDLHTGFESNEQLPKQFHKENALNLLVPEDRPKPEKVVDRLTTRKLTKAGKRLKECHQFARVTDMVGYDEAQELELQNEMNGLRDSLPPKETVTFSDLNDYDDHPISYRHLYDECVIRPKFVRQSRVHPHFPGGVAINNNMSNIYRINGVPVSQLIRERNYPHDEASVFSNDTLAVDQRKHLSEVKKTTIKLERQVSRLERQASRLGIATTTEDPSIPWNVDIEDDETRATSLFMAHIPIVPVQTVLRTAKVYNNRWNQTNDDETDATSVTSCQEPASKDSQNDLYMVKRTAEILRKHKEKVANQKYKLKSSKPTRSGGPSEERNFELKKSSDNQRFSLRKKLNSQSASNLAPATGPLAQNNSTGCDSKRSGKSNNDKKKSFKLKISKSKK